MNAMNDTPLPKQDLLLKLLRMTTSDNDGEAIAAIRKANALMNSAGWDWEKLIKGKITVVADPFASVPDPRRNVDSHPAPPPPYRPAPAAPPRPTPPPPRAAPAANPSDWGMGNVGVNPQARKSYTPPKPPGRINSTRPNKYGNDCYCCGYAVAINDGFIFKPRDFGLTNRDGWKVVCAPCNNDPNLVLKPTAARSKSANLSDLI